MAIKASELKKQIEVLIKNHGDLDVLISFDSYCHNECVGIEFKEADSKSNENYFLL